jgi:hypothetical protein
MATSYYWNRHKLQEREPTYPYHAETSSTTRARKSFGEHVAYCTRYQYKTWAFKTVAARDKFVDITGAKRIFSSTERRILHMEPITR